MVQAPPGLPPLPPPRLQLPEARRYRIGFWLSLAAHLVVLLLIVELTRDATFWEPADQPGHGGMRNAEGGGGGARVHLLQLPAPPAPPPVLPAPVPAPVKVPTTIPPPEPAPVAPPADTLPRPPATEAGGTGGGTGGGSGGGAGPGTGPGSGPGSGGGGTAPDSSRGGARPPEPRQLILPPFDYPRSMRGLTIDVNFSVLADGRVDHVVFVPEIPDRAYAKKLEDAMRSYRFRPARSADGQAVPGIAIVKVSF